LPKAGNNNEAKIAIIAITTSNSINVNPRAECGRFSDKKTDECFDKKRLWDMFEF
jgi:hypothetical protein